MPGGNIKKGLRYEWQRLQACEPGERFIQCYQRCRPADGRRAIWVRPLVLVVAVVCVLIGLVLAVMPGPALLFYALAAALVATQFRWAAEWLDRAEVWCRRCLRKAKRRWSRWRGRCPESE